MKNYQEIDLTTPIEDLQSSIEKDYEKIFKLYRLPKALTFNTLKKAVHKGMEPKKDYPFALLQKLFVSHLSSMQIREDEFNSALQVFIAVWNYFPHKDLGMSPLEKVREEADDNRDDATSTIIASIFQDGQYHRLLDEYVLFLSKMAKTILTDQIKKIGGNQKDVTTIVKLLEKPTVSPDVALDYLLLSFTKKAKQTSNRTVVEEVQPAVRALAFCENHISSKMSNNHYNSRMFQYVAETVMQYMDESMKKGERIIHPLEVLEGLADAHASIQVVGEKVGAHGEVIASAHHILDWVIFADVFEVLKKTPLEMALTMIEGACIISNTADPRFDTGCSSKDIRKERGVTDKNTTYEKETKRLLEMAICECNDPYLMVPNLYDKNPDKCVMRLGDLAPCITLRSPDEFLPDSLRY